MDIVTLGHRLHALRKLAEFTRHKVSELSGIPEVTIRSWEQPAIGSDIYLFKLLNYLRIYQQSGITLSLDRLLTLDENSVPFELPFIEQMPNLNDKKLIPTLSNTYSKDSNLLNSTYVQGLFQTVHNLIFYADIHRKIHYFNPIFNYLVVKKTTCTFSISSLCMTDIILKAINLDYEEAINNVLNGQPLVLEIITTNNHSIALKLLPNFNNIKEVIGFAALYYSNL